MRDVIAPQKNKIGVLLLQNRYNFFFTRPESFGMKIRNKGNLFAGQCVRQAAIRNLIMMNIDGVSVVVDLADQDERKN